MTTINISKQFATDETEPPNQAAPAEPAGVDPAGRAICI